MYNQIKKGGENMSVPEYTKRAINKYNSKWDRIAINLPIGYKDKIRGITGKSCNAYISELVIKDIERMERETDRNELPDCFN